MVMAGLGLYIWRVLNPRQAKVLTVPYKWKVILGDHVHFYQNLDTTQKTQFESDVQHFLTEVTISGVQTEVTLLDRLLIASSAVIPLFGFPAWTYSHLDEVLLYPDSFDEEYNIGGPNARISGMVGNGPMEGKVIFSKPALHRGFDINNDKRNVGIHEFVHLFDKEDGLIDGIPPSFVDQAHTGPWLELIRKETNQIMQSKSTIDSYAGYNQQEFLAVASEYFFERPHLLKKKEPELYDTLCEVFKQDPSRIISEDAYGVPTRIPRNAPCPCGSGLKYKRCCME